MPYAFYYNHTFSLIDSTPKNGLFCQFFSSSHSPKPIQLQFQNTKEYSAHMDENGKLYVAAMPNASHLNYYILENNRFSKSSLISNTSSNYSLSSPIIYTLNHTPYIVYLSHQIHSNIYNFVSENLSHSNLTTLLTTHQAPESIKYFTTPSGVYIFYISFEESYCLNALYITPHSSKVLTFITSNEPISDYSICIDENIIHITYVTELHGKYQLFYYNTNHHTVVPLATTQYPSHPVVFCYYHALWINAIIEHKLHMYISVDQGITFSLPVPCSLQNNIHLCHFQSPTTHSLVAQELYASISSTFKLCTIAMIDIDGLHSEVGIAPELELLLEGFLFASRQPAPPQVSPAPSPSTPPVSSPTKPRYTAPPSSYHSVENAKNAFMEQDLSWDLPPRI